MIRASGFPETPWTRVVFGVRSGKVLDVVQTRSARESFRWGSADVRAGERHYGEPVRVELYRSLEDANAGTPYAMVEPETVGRVSLSIPAATIAERHCLARAAWLREVAR